MTGVLLSPRNIRIEAALLGQLLLLNSDIGSYFGELSADIFFDQGHKNVYEAISALWLAGNPIATHSVEAELRRFYPAGDYKNIPNLTESLTKNAGYGDVLMYIDTLKELAFRRNLLAITQQVAEMAYDESLPVDEVRRLGVSSVMQLLGENAGGGGRLYTGAELWDEAWAVYTANATNNTYGITTGFYDLDRFLEGLLEGQLILVAARPAMGKTTFMFQVLRHITNQLKKRVLFISLEMTSVMLTTRLVCNITGMNYALVRKGKYSAAEHQSMEVARQEVQNMPISLFYNDMICAVTELPLLLKSIYARSPFDIVMIDYLGLFNARGSHNKVDETTAIVQSFKGCAIKMNVPIIAAVQLSRGVEQRHDKHPVLSDLRDSGALEQTADIVLSLYRPGYYDENAVNADTLEVGILKHRDGPTGMAVLGWDAASYRIYNRIANQQGQQSNYGHRP